MIDRTVSRRSALQTGTLFLGAGLLGSTTTPVAADPLPAATVATVVNYPDLASNVERLLQENQDALHAAIAACNELKEELEPVDYRRVMDYIENVHDIQHDVWTALVLAEIMRHLPGLAPALYHVALHVQDSRTDQFGTCCLPEGSA